MHCLCALPFSSPSLRHLILSCGAAGFVASGHNAINTLQSVTVWLRIAPFGLFGKVLGQYTRGTENTEYTTNTSVHILAVKQG